MVDLLKLVSWLEMDDLVVLEGGLACEDFDMDQLDLAPSLSMAEPVKSAGVAMEGVPMRTSLDLRGESLLAEADVACDREVSAVVRDHRGSVG